MTGEQPGRPDGAEAQPPASEAPAPDSSPWQWDPKAGVWRTTSTAHAAGSPPPPAAPPRFVASDFVRARPAPPDGRFAGILHRLSGGAVSVGVSREKLLQAKLTEEARTNIKDPPSRIAVASAKGGVGKSTMALLLASQFGMLRNDRIIAVECNPHHGTFRSRVRTHHERSIKDLIDFLDGGGVHRDEDLTLPMLHRFTTQVPEARLEVLTAPTDPKLRQALRLADYQRVFRLLYRYFDIIVFDLGTGLLDDITKYILEQVCDQSVVVAPAELDGAELGTFTLDFIADARGVPWVRQRSVVVLNRVTPNTQVDVIAMEGHFNKWVRSCLRVSQDPHLRMGGIFEWPRMSPASRSQILALAAEVGKGLALGAAPDSEPALS